MNVKRCSINTKRKIENPYDDGIEGTKVSNSYVTVSSKKRPKSRDQPSCKQRLLQTVATTSTLNKSTNKSVNHANTIRSGIRNKVLVPNTSNITNMTVSITCNSQIPQVSPDSKCLNQTKHVDLAARGSRQTESTTSTTNVKNNCEVSFTFLPPPSPTPSDDSSVLKKLLVEDNILYEAEKVEKCYHNSIDNFYTDLGLNGNNLDLCDRSYDSSVTSDEGPERCAMVHCKRNDGEEVCIIQPSIQYNCNCSYRPNYASVEKPLYHECFGHEQYALFKDRDYNRNYHMIINGCLERYAGLVFEIVSKLEKRMGYTRSFMEHKTYRLQRRFAEKRVRMIQKGLKKFDLFPVKILNEKYLIEMVDGIDNVEHATLVKMIATTESFQVKALKNNSSTEDIDIVTMFDGSFKLYSFGKNCL